MKYGVDKRLLYVLVGHFLLTNMLLENMKRTARESGKEGRIVNVSSRRHRFSYLEGIRFDRINDEAGCNAIPMQSLDPV